MPNPIQILRSAVTGNRPPAGKLPGEPYVNWADKAFGVVDAAGVPVDLTAVRHWSAEAAYAKDDHVIQDGRLYSARDAIAPGPFVQAQWLRLTRKRLYAPMQLYVDGATGNDLTGDGSQAAPWATVFQAGAWITQELDLNGYTVFLRVAAGDYDFANLAEFVGGGSVMVIGAGKDVTNIRKFNIRFNNETLVSLNAMTLKPLANDNAILIESAKAQIEGATGFAIDLTVSAWGVAHLTANSTLRTYGPIEIRTNGVISSQCFDLSGSLWGDAADWTLIGASPNTYNPFVLMDDSRYDSSASFSGVSLGKRFVLRNGSLADTTQTLVRDGDFGLTITPGDADARRVDLFPGDIPGTWDSSSWYDGVQGGATYDQPHGDGSYFVDAAGDDTTGDGLSVATAWATIRKAFDHLALYPGIAGVVVINVGAGSFAWASVSWPSMLKGTGYVRISGAGSTLTTWDGGSFYGTRGGAVPKLHINHITLNEIVATYGADVTLGQWDGLANDVVIDTATMVGTDAPLIATYGSILATSTGTTGTIELCQGGRSYASVISLKRGSQYIEGGSWTLTGATPDTCSTGFISADSDSSYIASGVNLLRDDEGRVIGEGEPSPLIFAGPQTIGPKFLLSNQSWVATGGAQGAAAVRPGGLDYFPGTLPGVLDASSSYDGVNGGPKPRRKADWGDAFYVDVAGNDANDGGSAATPWATLQRAADFFSNEYDFGIVGVTVTIGVGTFVGPKMFNLRGGGGSGGKVVFSGAGVDQTIVTENNAGACFYAENFHGRIVIEKMTVRASPGYVAFLVDECLLYLYGPLALETAGIGGASESYIYVSGAIELRMTGANVGNAFGIKSHSHFVDAAAWTLSGATPNNYANWMSLDEVSYYQHAGATYAGSTTGKRFSGTHGSIFNSGGVGQMLLPGDTPGTLDASSYYDGVQGGQRRVLTANESFYVDVAGLDTNSGSSAATAFLTLQKAFDTVAKTLDLNGLTVTINIGAGSFFGGVLAGMVGGGRTGKIFVYGAGSALTTITPPGVGSPYYATIGFGLAGDGGLVKCYLNGVSIVTNGNDSCVTGVNAYSIYLMDSASWLTDIVLIPASNQGWALIDMVNSTLSTGAGSFEVRASTTGVIPSVIRVTKGSVLSDNADWVLTGIVNVAALVKGEDKGTLRRDAGTVTGDISGVQAQYSMSTYSHLTVNNSAFYPGPPGITDASGMYQGVMGNSISAVQGGTF